MFRFSTLLLLAIVCLASGGKPSSAAVAANAPGASATAPAAATLPSRDVEAESNLGWIRYEFDIYAGGHSCIQWKPKAGNLTLDQHCDARQVLDGFYRSTLDGRIHTCADGETRLYMTVNLTDHRVILTPDGANPNNFDQDGFYYVPNTGDPEGYIMKSGMGPHGNHTWCVTTFYNNDVLYVTENTGACVPAIDEYGVDACPNDRRRLEGELFGKAEATTPRAAEGAQTKSTKEEPRPSAEGAGVGVAKESGSPNGGHVAGLSAAHKAAAADATASSCSGSSCSKKAGRPQQDSGHRGNPGLRAAAAKKH